VRCAACGARNSDRATWCTQCYAPLGDAAAPPPGGPPADEPPVTPTSPAPGSQPPGSQPLGSPPLGSERSAPASSAAVPASDAAGGADRDVRDRDGVVEWRCRRCEAWSPLLSSTCTTCGGPREGFGEDPPTTAARVPDVSVLLAVSVVLPGVGHLLAGRPGTGVARLLLWLLWLGPGLPAVLGAQGAVAALPGLVLLAGAAVLWATTLVDVQRLAGGDGREVLTSRRLLWLVGAVVAGAVLAVFVATLTVR
jgi:hypothetical protein